MSESPELDPDVAAIAPTGTALTAYDRRHFITYLRLLDAVAENAPWEDVARIVLRMDPTGAPEVARRAFQTHLERARWMTEAGYLDLLKQPRSS